MPRFKIQSCKQWSNRHWLLDTHTGQEFAHTHNYEQAEYLCNSYNRKHESGADIVIGGQRVVIVPKEL